MRHALEKNWRLVLIWPHKVLWSARKYKSTSVIALRLHRNMANAVGIEPQPQDQLHHAMATKLSQWVLSPYPRYEKQNLNWLRFNLQMSNRCDAPNHRLPPHNVRDLKFSSFFFTKRKLGLIAIRKPGLKISPGCLRTPIFTKHKRACEDQC